MKKSPMKQRVVGSRAQVMNGSALKTPVISGKKI